MFDRALIPWSDVLVCRTTRSGTGDSIGTEFAGRHELYELLYSGHPDITRTDTLEHAEHSGLTAELDILVEECMTDYDLTGWTAPDLQDPDDPTPTTSTP